ncbi:MAG: hypothetical protein ABSE83_10140 [Methanobacterium sp.]|jgi:hypothetical protein
MAEGKEPLSKIILHAFHVIFAFLRNILIALAKPLSGLASIGSTGLVIGTATLLGSFLILGFGITVLPQGHEDTMLYFSNNGQSWDHIAATLSTGNSTKQIYINIWIKPGGNVSFDLSKALGYSDQPAPVGTIFTFSAYKNILTSNPGGNGNLNLNVQGYSGDGQHNANLFNSQYPGIPVEQLPNNIKNSGITYSSNPSNGQQYYSSINPSGSVYEQESFTINNDGTVTIKSLVSPVLCQIVTL